MAEMFLIDKKSTVDKPLTGSITKCDKALLQFSTAMLITNNVVLLHLSRQRLLQFTTGITIYDIITIQDRTNALLKEILYFLLQ